MTTLMWVGVVIGIILLIWGLYALITSKNPDVGPLAGAVLELITDILSAL